MAKILVIDDDDQQRWMLKQLFEHDHHIVIEARNGEEGLLTFKEQSPDLVITDIVMPLKDGVTLIGELQFESPQTRIIAISGGPRGDVGQLPNAKIAGAVQILEKPFSIHKMREVVDRILKSPF